MRKILPLFTLTSTALFAAAYASAEDHFSVNLTGGYAYSQIEMPQQINPIPANETTYPTSHGKTGFGKLSLGFHLNPYLGISIGVIAPGNTSVDTRFTSGEPYGSNHLKSSYRGYDALLNFSIPATKDLKFTLSGGATYARISYSSSFSGPISQEKILPPNYTSAKSSGWTPTVALAASYQVSRHIALTLSDQYIWGRDKNKLFTIPNDPSPADRYTSKDLSQYIPAINLAGIGLTVSF